MKILAWIQSYHLQWKFKLLAGKFTWCNKFVNNTQQCFAFDTSSKIFRTKFEYSLKVMESNPGYLLKSFLLYRKLQPKLVLTLLLFRGVSDISSAYNFLKFRSTIYIKSSTSLTVHAVTFSSQGSFPSAKYRFAHLFSSIFLFVFPYRTFFHFFSKKKKSFFLLFLNIW